MSNKQCRETCDVYADWLKAGETITGIQASNEQYLKQLEDVTLENIGLREHIKLHAGDCCSLSNESDMFRGRAEDAEAELAKIKSRP